MRKTLLISAASFIMGAGAMAAVGEAAHADNAKTYKMLQLYGDVLDTIDSQYVTKVDDTKLIQAGIEGMMTSLDPHSDYLDQAGYKDLQDTTKGQYGGLGLEIESDGGEIKIQSPIDDTPASRAGLKSGDVILAVDGVSLSGMSTNDAVDKMRGDVGQPVTLTIARAGEDAKDYKLVREVIHPKAVTYHMEGDYGYLRLAQFSETATDEMTAAIKDLQAKNPNIKGYIFDLRNNPGGLLDQAVGVADVFLDGGEVVSQRGRDPKDIQRYNAKPGDLTNGAPLVVLINDGSASASEIVAGALHDRKRATVVGTTSFGKGSVQSIIELNGGKDGAVKLTTGLYYTPSGASIQKIGVVPDLEVAESRDEAKIMADVSYTGTESSFVNTLSNADTRQREGAHKPQEEPPEGFDETKDYQLQRAVAVLKAGSVQTLLAQESTAKTVASVDPANKTTN